MSDFLTMGGAFVRSSFEMTAAKTFTIPAGQTGELIDAVDLGANSKGIAIAIPDCSVISAGKTLYAQAAETADGALCDVYLCDQPNVRWSAELPTSRSWRILLADAFGARRLRFILSAALATPLTILIYGYDLGA